MNDDLTLILERLERYFDFKRQTVYTVEVVNDSFDQLYNFFLAIKPRNQRLKSIPLHSITTYDLEYLEQLVTELKKQSLITIKFIDFKQLRWHSTNQLIEFNRRNDEN